MRATRNQIRGSALLLALVAGTMAFSDAAPAVQLVSVVLNIIAISLMGVWLWMGVRDTSPKK